MSLLIAVAIVMISYGVIVGVLGALLGPAVPSGREPVISKDILPIKRGRVLTKVTNTIGIDLDNTEWMDQPLPELAPWEPHWLLPAVWMQRHEFKVWVMITLTLTLFL